MRSGSPMTNDPKTQTMMAAAAVMTRPVAAIPSATAPLASPVRHHSSWIRDSRNTGAGDDGGAQIADQRRGGGCLRGGGRVDQDHRGIAVRLHRHQNPRRAAGPRRAAAGKARGRGRRMRSMARPNQPRKAGSRLIGALGFTLHGDTIAEIELISERDRLRDVVLTAPGH
jgi:hypothetical protein